MMRLMAGAGPGEQRFQIAIVRPAAGRIVQRADPEGQHGIDMMRECDTGEQSVDAKGGSATFLSGGRLDQFKAMAEFEWYDDQRAAIAVGNHAKVLSCH